MQIKLELLSHEVVSGLENKDLLSHLTVYWKSVKNAQNDGRTLGKLIKKSDLTNMII